MRSAERRAGRRRASGCQCGRIGEREVDRKMEWRGLFVRLEDWYSDAVRW